MSEIDEMKEGILEAHAHYLMVQREEQGHQKLGEMEGQIRVALRRDYDEAVAASVARVAESEKLVLKAKADLEAFQKDMKARFRVTIDLSAARPVGRVSL